MTLLVDQLRKDITELDATIDEQRTTLKNALKDEKRFTEIMKTHRELNDKLSSETKERKIKKFNKHKKESMEGSIYYWRNQEPPPDESTLSNTHRGGRSTQRQLPLADYDHRSTSASSSTSSAGFYQRTHNQRGRGRPRGRGNAHPDAQGGGRGTHRRYETRAYNNKNQNSM